jgi:aminoglycoside 3-N-acetyltransferase
MDEISYRDIVRGLRALGLTGESKVIVHSALSSMGRVRGGAAAVLGALLHVCDTIVLPAFTYQSMVWPLVGPPNNGVDYDDPQLPRANSKAEYFHPNLPVHRDVGSIPEWLRRHRRGLRSGHAVLSFVAAGRHAREALASQTLDHPLAPIEWLQHQDGDVVLLGVGHQRNTSIHLAERLAQRTQFLRWAIASDSSDGQTQVAVRPIDRHKMMHWIEAHGHADGVVRALELPNFPGCSEGFDAVEAEIKHATTQVTIGNAIVQRVRLALLIPIVVGWITEEPLALLCERPDCARCQAVRNNGT